jgi:hypothetical protein
VRRAGIPLERETREGLSAETDGSRGNTRITRAGKNKNETHPENSFCRRWLTPELIRENPRKSVAGLLVELQSLRPAPQLHHAIRTTLAHRHD